MNLARQISLLLISVMATAAVHAETRADVIARYAGLLSESRDASRDASRLVAGSDGTRALDDSFQELTKLIEGADDIAFRQKLETLRFLINDTRQGGNLVAQREAAWHEVFGEDGHALQPVGRDPLGSRCLNAISLVADRSLRLRTSGRGDGNSIHWFKWVAPGKGNYVVLARSDEGDPRLALFRHCSEINLAPAGFNDDGFGLDSELLIEAEYPGQVFHLRLDHAGRASAVTLGSTPATVVTGTVVRESNGEAASYVSVYASAAGDSGIRGSGYVNHLGEFQLSLWNLSETQPIVLRTTANWPNSIGLLHEAWPDAPCFFPTSTSTLDCEPPTPLMLTPGETREHIDFALSEGAMIHGRVRDEVTNELLQGIRIVVAAGGNQIQEAVTDTAGRYQAKGLAAGAYTVFALGEKHAPRAFDGFDCDDAADCLSTLSTRLDVAHLGSVPADFTLEPRSYVDATIVVEGLASADTTYAYFEVRHQNGLLRTMYAGRGENGKYRLGPFEDGAYRINARVPGKTFRQWYGGIHCATDCMTEALQGATVSINGPGSRPEINFDLKKLPRISGRITNSSDGQAPSFPAQFRLFRPNSTYTDAATAVDETGNYQIQFVEPGEYYAVAQAVSYVDEIWPGIACEQRGDYARQACPGAQTIQVGLTSGDQTLDFALEPSPAVFGRVTSNGDAMPSLSYSFMPRLFSPHLQRIAYVNVLFNNDDSTYRIVDHLPGNYFIAAGLEGHYPRVAPDLDCTYSRYFQDEATACAWQDATQYELGANDVNVDFNMKRWGQRVSVTNTAGTPLAGVGIDVWNYAGLPLQSVVTGANGTAILTSHDSIPGPVRISTDNYLGYIDQVYESIDCPTGTSVFRGGCTLEGARAFDYTAVDPDTPVIEIHLRSGLQVFYDDFE